MHPELFSIGDFTVHTYGFMIMVGAMLGYFYMAHTAKKDLGIEPERIQNLALIVIVMAFLGGKVFFYLEDPAYYFGTPSNMLKGFRTGFTFYGSLLFVIPAVVWYFRKMKWPLWPMMDRIAIAGCIIHACGRMGCFFAGCCHGVPTDSWLGVSFTATATQADPVGVPLHPTQLYSVTLILTILVILVQLKRHQRFEGQLFLVYVSLYALGRGVIEIFRGDERRGFIIDGWLSHSQLISLIVIAGAAGLYWYLRKRQKAT